MANDTARIDKWLWAARIFKTRSIAANACKNGRVTINGTNVKPSHMVKTGETVNVKKPPITFSFKILQCPKQYEILEMSRISGFVDRARGTGRPTKKERRSLDAFIEPAMFGLDDFDFDDYDIDN